MKNLNKNRAIRNVCLVAFLVLINSTVVFANNSLDTGVTGEIEVLINKVIAIIGYGSGGLLSAFGVIELWLARGSQNPDTKSQGVQHLVTGIGLMIICISIQEFISLIFSKIAM